MSEYEEVDPGKDEMVKNSDEEITLRRIVVLDKEQEYPVNGTNNPYRMGDVLAFRKRQAERYVEKVDNEIMDARYAEDGDGNIEEPYTGEKSELAEELGKVGEVPRLKDKLEAMMG